jgi:hypothetical protein
MSDVGQIGALPWTRLRVTSVLHDLHDVQRAGAAAV